MIVIQSILKPKERCNNSVVEVSYCYSTERSLVLLLSRVGMFRYLMPMPEGKVVYLVRVDKKPLRRKRREERTF